MKKIYLVIFIIASTSYFSNGQNIKPLWSKFVGSTLASGGSVIRDFDVDSQGNIIAVGTFIGFSNFTDMTTNNLTFTVDGGADAFIAKYAKNGELIWRKQFKGPFSESFNKIKIDKNQNIYVCGQFQDSLYFDNQVIHSPNLLNPASACLIKFSPVGDYLWHKVFSTDNTFNTSDDVKDIDFDKNNNLFYTVTSSAPRVWPGVIVKIVKANPRSLSDFYFSNLGQFPF